MLPKLPSVLLMLLALACGDDALAAGSNSPAARVRLFASRRSLLYAELTLAEWAGIAERYPGSQIAASRGEARERRDAFGLTSGPRADQGDV
jgi:hypothetical protein